MSVLTGLNSSYGCILPLSRTSPLRLSWRYRTYDRSDTPSSGVGLGEVKGHLGITCNGATGKKNKNTVFGRSFQSEFSVFSSVLLFDVQRKGGRRHQPVAAAAARHHGNAAPAVPVEAAAGAGGRRGRGGGRGGLLELLLVDFALFGPTVLEPDLHLEVRRSCFYLNRTS